MTTSTDCVSPVRAPTSTILRQKFGGCRDDKFSDDISDALVEVTDDVWFGQLFTVEIE